MLSTVEEIEHAPRVPVLLAEPALVRSELARSESAPSELTRPEVEDDYSRDQTAVLVDGAFFSLMVGLGETYLPAFALALGASHLVSGLENLTPDHFNLTCYRNPSLLGSWIHCLFLRFHQFRFHYASLV